MMPNRPTQAVCRIIFALDSKGDADACDGGCGGSIDVRGGLWGNRTVGIRGTIENHDGGASTPFIQSHLQAHAQLLLLSGHNGERGQLRHTVTGAIFPISLCSENIASVTLFPFRFRVHLTEAIRCERGA
jgi:hypothetical protein